MKITNTSLLFYIISVAFIIRLILALYGYYTKVYEGFADDLAYYSLAESVMTQGFFLPDITSMNSVAKVVGPGMGWILAILFTLLGKSWLVIFLFNTLLSTGLCILIYYLGKELFNETIGLMALIWSSVYYFYLRFIVTSGKEIWIHFLFLSTIFCVLRFRKVSRKWIPLLLCSLSYSLLIHIDERFFAYIPLLFVALFMLNTDSIIKKLQSALIFSLIVFMCMVPWLIRNYHVYHKIVILSVRTAPITDKLFGYPYQEYYANNDWAWELTPTQIDSVRNGYTAHLIDGEIRPEFAAAIRRGLLPHKFSTGEKLWSRFLELWAPVDFHEGYKLDGYLWDGKWSLKHNLVSGLMYGMLIPFFFYGMLKLKTKDNQIFVFLLCIFIWHTIIHVLFIPYTLERYRIVLDCFLIVLAASSIQPFMSKMQRKFRQINFQN